MPYPAGTTVFHPSHGEGQVRQDLGETVIVRFATELHELLANELEVRRQVEETATIPSDRILDVVTKALALSIRSVNDQWGVFGRSRIQLLPHQLWVCHRILETWPNRWLIADDVGLGKTVEAGLAVLALSARQLINRVLILCPASLCQQWQERLLRMFDLRFHIFHGEDAQQETVWDISSQVIASLHTVRSYAAGQDQDDPRLLAMLSAKAWDLIIVDEAHHLNHDETAGMTLGYRLVKKLDDEGQLKGMLLFTGTPHRGKDFSFQALLHLLNPQLFDPHGSISEQIPHIGTVMIRNNKQAVTNLEGKPLFMGMTVHSEEYTYSEAEREFYQRMTEFILSGRTYANKLMLSARRTNNLVLTTLQKLASSSIAAVSHTLRSRLQRLHDAKGAATGVPDLETMWAAPEPEQGDEANRFAENFVIDAGQLLQGEAAHLQILLDLASAVSRETKIERIITMAERLPAGDPLLIFTEFKATQRAIFIRLAETYGHQSVTFLNGDGFLRDVPVQHGGPEVVSTKVQAAKDFNEGRRRFLISTEAGGEGIDLQHSCNAVVHADLPWNPMRLHQRNGRLYRLNQRRAVEVTLLRNPETLESRIWELLEEKLQRIQHAYCSAMEAPEDIAQLVLGMAPPGTYDRMHVESLGRPASEVQSSIADATAFLDTQRALDTVLAIFGNCGRFDFGTSANHLPKVDLPDLRSFLELSLKRHKRALINLADDPDAFELITPEPWSEQRGIKQRYRSLHTNRLRPGKDAMVNLVGVGHPVVDLALREAINIPARSCRISAGNDILVICQILDRVTSGASRPFIYAGLLLQADGSHQILLDWELILRLNTLSKRYRQWDKQDTSGAILLPVPAHRLSAALPQVIELALRQRQLTRPEAQVVLTLYGASVTNQNASTDDSDPRT